MVRDLESVNDYEEYEPDDVPMLTNSGGSFSMDSEQEDVCTFQVGSSRNMGFDSICFFKDSVLAERTSKARGRRVSSLGDEMYYTIDCEVGLMGGAGGVAAHAHNKVSRLNVKHQHSLESYQLYKEKLTKIREKQACMPGRIIVILRHIVSSFHYQDGTVEIETLRDLHRLLLVSGKQQNLLIFILNSNHF